MTRWRTGWRVACLSATSLFFAAGCPNGTGLLGDAGAGDAPTTEEDVFKVLASTAKAFEAGDDEALDSEDEPAFFGENADNYDAPTDAKVELSEDSVAGEVANSNGEKPVLHGTLAGEFLTDDESATSDDSGGVFRGEWTDADGNVDGYVRGEFRPFDAATLPQFIAGGGRFHGKLVNADGRFHGRVRGLYGHTADGRTLFVGRWFDRHERLVGVLKGHWNDEEAGGGAFAGRWAAFNLCGESDKLDEVPFEAGDFGGLDTTNVDVSALDEGGEPSVATASENQTEDGDVSLDPDDKPLDDELDVKNDSSGACTGGNLPHGFVRGWHQPNGDDQAAQTRGDGTFQADWHSRDGLTEGYLVGIYEMREAQSGDDQGDASDADNGNSDDTGDGAADDSDDADGGDADVGDGGGDVASDDGASELDSRPAREPASRGTGAAGQGGSAPANRGTAGANAGSPMRTHGAFFGKWYDRDGTFRGYVRGMFGQGPHGLGVFRGKYFDADGRPKGVLRGRWDDARDAEGGPIFGIWVGADLGEGSSTGDADSSGGSDTPDDAPSDEPADPNAASE